MKLGFDERYLEYYIFFPINQELMDKEEEKSEEGSEEESSEYEEYSDSEEEETGPRLKPVFVRKYVNIISFILNRSTYIYTF